ncbi:MAG: hypothetical protein GX455_01470 [Phycisphaerae bacterium]|nr:hypothetical protein [Phycisphaerae bacterium]
MMRAGAILLVLNSVTLAGPYNESGVAGWVDGFFRPAPPPGSTGYTRHPDPNSIRVHPLFRGWATGYRDYMPSGSNWDPGNIWKNPFRALGPATGNLMDIVSLGDLTESELLSGILPGSITLSFGDPNRPESESIRNGRGYDFAVFENAILSLVSTPGGSIAGRTMAELAFVEVSTNGIDFARFPSVSLTAGRVGPYGTIDVTDVYNVAGKHPNADSVCTGTPFDLDDLRDHPMVQEGYVNLDDIRFIRLVDIPGNGSFSDQSTDFPDPSSYDPNSVSHFQPYSSVHPIYDAWLTFGSGGFDLEAVGVLREQQFSADINLDGRVDLEDWALFARAWQKRFGQVGYLARCDLTSPKDASVDMDDLVQFSGQWLSVEDWRIESTRYEGAL